jgi:hypothetical protein
MRCWGWRGLGLRLFGRLWLVGRAWLRGIPMSPSAPCLLPLPFGERVGVRGCQTVLRLERPLTQPSPRRGEGF